MPRIPTNAASVLWQKMSPELTSPMGALSWMKYLWIEPNLEFLGFCPHVRIYTAYLGCKLIWMKLICTDTLRGSTIHKPHLHGKWNPNSSSLAQGSLVYSGVHIRIDKPGFMKQIAYFWPTLVGNKNAIRLQPFRLHFSVDCSFKMRYCSTFYLNCHRIYERSNLELPNSLNKKHAFNFSLT